jgi:hypothetical protein
MPEQPSAAIAMGAAINNRRTNTTNTPRIRISASLSQGRTPTARQRMPCLPFAPKARERDARDERKESAGRIRIGIEGSHRLVTHPS